MSLSREVSLRDFVSIPYGHGGGHACPRPAKGRLSAHVSPAQPAREPSIPTLRNTLRNRQDRLGRAIRAPVWILARRWDRAVAAYLDCGLFESGFARVQCPNCKVEFLVAFSCRCRGLCPSCSAKRAAIFSELLQHKILADMPHAQWVFSIPKMLRPYFLYHQELLGDLARLAYETVRETDGGRCRGARRAAGNGRRHPDLWVVVKIQSSYPCDRHAWGLPL